MPGEKALLEGARRVMCQVWMLWLGGRAMVKPSGGSWETSANSWGVSWGYGREEEEREGETDLGDAFGGGHDEGKVTMVDVVIW